MTQITTTSAYFNAQGIPTNTPNVINPSDILHHTHNITINRTTGLQGFPDFSRMQLMYSGSEYCGTKYRQFHRFPIFKINSPGYLYYQQFRYNLDTDVICLLSNNPYNFLCNYNYGNQYNYNYANINGNTNNSAYNLPVNDNSSQKTMYWGDAGGNTYQTKFFPIYPGNNTYCLIAPPRASYAGIEFYNFYFVPCMGTDSNQSCFTKVGETMYWNTQSLYARATMDNLGPSIFNRSGTSNTIKIKAFQCKGTAWNWNYKPYDNWDDHVGFRYYLINPNSRSTQHVYQMQHNWAHQISYNKNKNKWCLYHGNSIIYESATCESTVDPWMVNWTRASGYQSWALPILEKCKWL